MVDSVSTAGGRFDEVRAMLGQLDRAANASIRGYLTQVVYTALSWLDLADDEVLVVEGREDLDRILLDSDGRIREVSEVQLKDLTSAVNARSEAIWESIFNFLLSYRYHHEAGRRARMLFATTASLKGQATAPSTGVRQTEKTTRLDLEVDVISTWASLADLATEEASAAVQKLARAVRALFDTHLRPVLPDPADPNKSAEAQHAESVLAEIEKHDANSTWVDFFRAVSWLFDLDAAPGMVDRLKNKIAKDPRLSGLPDAEFAPVLIYRVLSAASQDEVEDRFLTRDGLQSIAGESADSLRQWAKLHGLVNLSQWQLLAKETLIKHGERLDELETAVAAALPTPERARSSVMDFTRSTRRRVRLDVGGVHLVRRTQLSALDETLASTHSVVVLGPSGAGKSALARSYTERLESEGALTLWLGGASLERADLADLQSDISLGVPLPTVFASHQGRATLVIDGLDRVFESSALTLLADLLDALNIGRTNASCDLVVTCQTPDWPRLERMLRCQGVDVSGWTIQECPSPNNDELKPVWDAIPAARRLALEPRLAALMQNLKVLDLVASQLAHGADLDATRFVGESSVASWFWDLEVAQGSQRRARDVLSMRLGELQADRLSLSVPIHEFHTGDASVLDELEAANICVVDERNRVLFAHDLFADWARLRAIQSHEADLKDYLRSRVDSPLWHRAIRLLGIHLLERANGIDEWKTLMSSFDSGDMAIVRDLLLEAPAYAMNAGTLLNSVFPDLVAGDGALLRRLMRRFLAFATVPDEQMQEIARSIGMEASAARAAYRRPHWPYWLDVLAVLYRHRDDALRVAPSEVARAVEMWLVFLPPGSIRRREVAEIAVMLGQRALDTRDVYGRRELRKERERFYKCALLAAPERPDEVAELAKTAAERVPSPVTEVVDAARRPRPQGIVGSSGIVGPWPDGPHARVDDAFESVVLDSGTIRHLFGVRPAVARGVILGTLIKAPQEKHWMHAGELGLARRFKWHPSLFTRGPFLLCLRENFDEGLELIMHLVEFVTERSNEHATRKVAEWRARAVADGRSSAEIDEAAKGAPPQHLVLHDGTRELRFMGDAGSYGWSAGVTCQGYSPPPPAAVASALMALEQYFYERLDAGQDITDEVRRTLARSRSVAPLGVLSDVGKRELGLFNGPLRALLSAPEIYAWEISKTVQGRTHLLIGAFDEGQYFVDLAREFHGLEHREHDLRYVATERLLESEEMQAFFATVRDWWKQRRAAGERLGEMADRLDLWLDPTNYEMRQDPTHGTVIVNVALERMQSERANEHQEMNDRILVTSFPLRCRTILDERQIQNDPHLEELWQAWSRIRELSETGPALLGREERLGDEYGNAIAGGIAVFLWHGEWLARHEEGRHSIETAIETIDGAPPGRNGFASAHDVSTWTWDCFLAEAAALLWVREPDNPRWRRLVAKMVFAEKYAVVGLLFSRCAEHRAALGDGFERLRRLAVEWAHVRGRVHDVLCGLQNRVPDEDEQALEDDVAVWVKQAISSFVAGTLEPMPADWNRFSEASRFAELDELRGRWFDSAAMDFHLVRRSHEWLPLPDETSSPEERENVIQFWRFALDVVAARPQADLQRWDQLYPHEDEVWVLHNVAAVVLQLRPSENPELFWGTIVDLHSEAHHWPEEFLKALHRHALSSKQMPATYGPLVRKIARRAFLEVDGAGRWPSHEAVWDGLLGIDWLVQEAWTERRGDHVAKIWDVISLWMDQAPQDGRRLARFARWLSTPAAAVVRLRTLPWFLERLRADRERSVYRDEDVDDGLAELLNVVWDVDQNRLHTTPESFSAFRGLLAWLVERQNALALELEGRIGGLA